MTPYQLFKEQFGLPFNKYIDVSVSSICGKPIIDIFKFDEWLRTRFGNYEESGFTMESLLVKHYGKDVADQIQSFL
jgi:hypothetical protein